ncbi:MAG: SWIM zinc finger family protein [bacterium]
MSKKKRYTLRTPLNVRGGIRVQNPHMGKLRVWWGRRWTEVLENFRLGARLGRGRNYAVSGQVSSLVIKLGGVVAVVQGSNKEPYESDIRFRAVEGDAKARIIQRLRQRPMVLARLLVSDFPFEIEGLFREEGYPLFPQREKDLTSRCSCPDYANPCKHLAAVYYLLGEAITKNPLLLLELRGISRADLLGDAAEPQDEALEALPSEGVAEVPLTHEGFYGAPQALFNEYGPALKSVTPAPLIYRLGPLPFWRGQERFTDTLEHLYARAATRGWTVWTGEPLDLRREDEKVIITGANLHLKNHKMRVDTSWT